MSRLIPTEVEFSPKDPLESTRRACTTLKTRVEIFVPRNLARLTREPREVSASDFDETYIC